MTASPWASPLGRWLRGLVLDSSSDLPSLSEVIAPVRQELEGTAALGVLFVRLGHWGRLAEVYSWHEFDEIYRGASRVALGSLGSGLREVDLPTDVGLQGEGFAVVLSRPRRRSELEQDTVVDVAQRLEQVIVGHLADSLVPRVHERLDVAVGAALLRAPEGDDTLEDAVVAALVEADASARRRQRAHEEALAEQLGRFLQKDSLTPIYVPLVDLERGQIAGWEVGVRGPTARELQHEDVLLDVARRSGREHRVLDGYHARFLADEGLEAGEGFYMIKAGASELLESAVRVNSLLYQRNANGVSADEIVFQVDAAEVLHQFPSSLTSFQAVTDLGFRTALDLKPDCPLPLDHIRHLEPDFVRLSGRSIQGIHRKQDEFDLLLLLARFAARHDIRLIAADCADRNEILVLQRAGVDLASGEYLAAAERHPARPEIQLP